MIEDRPLPATDDPLDAPYWQATLRGELVVQRCTTCNTWRFPPRPMCPSCQSFGHEWDVMSGRGRIWSFVVPHPPLLPAFTKIAPYNVIIVELAEDPTLRIVGNLLPSAGAAINEIDPGTIEIGAPVRAVFDNVADDLALIRWVPARATEEA
jgi:uncharacterized OB-fold protein